MLQTGKAGYLKPLAQFSFGWNTVLVNNSLLDRFCLDS